MFVKSENNLHIGTRWKLKPAFSSTSGRVLEFILVLIGLVIIFKSQLTDLVESIFTKITKQAGTI